MIEVYATINQRKRVGVQLKTILNRVQKHKRFIFGEISWAQDAKEPKIEVSVNAPLNSWAQCSHCRVDCAGYDTLAQKRYEFICSDIGRAYLNVVADKAAQAVQVLDRFHIMAHQSKAIDEVRAAEIRQMKADGFEPLLTNSRWVPLKRPENLTQRQEMKLNELLQYNLKTIRRYLLKEDFQQLWHYTSPTWAGQFIDRWCTKTIRSKIDPINKVAKRIRKHRKLVLNWFKADGLYSSGIVVGFNNKEKLTMRKAYGFKSCHTIEMALYHTIGALPEPKTTHRFF